MSESDRRTAERVDALVLVQFGETGRHGVTRDVSDKGLLIATRSRFSPGDRIEVTIHVTPPVKTTARVVRVEETPPTEEWRYRVAVVLDETPPAHAFEEGARAAAIFLPASKPPPSS